jgi:Family of unknown function (DUF6304)
MTAESRRSWAGWYRDRRGAEAITFFSSGDQVSTFIRGVEYAGADFPVLGPVGGGEPLVSCVLEWDVPLAVAVGGTQQQATLGCLLTLGELEPGMPAGRSELSVTLHWAGAAFGAAVAGSGFEEALDRVRCQLPDGAELGDRPLVGA